MNSTDDSSSETIRINKILCDENINSKQDARKWLFKNHPDKRATTTSFDTEKFMIIKNSISNNKYCKKGTRKNKTPTPSNKTSKNRSSSNKYRIPRSKMFNCIRKRANWSNIMRQHRFDNRSFDENKVYHDMPIAAPKIRQMLDIIDKLDAEDIKTHGKVFKHFIYSDVKEGGYGAKILASAFHADGYVQMIRARKVPGRISKQLYLRKKIDKVEEYQGFALLSSASIHSAIYTQKLKKEVISVFNNRKENVHGKNIRFIILDSGFKEGIDLFDVKYVHILEPSLTVADLKQTVGRATRTCGQKGLQFQENVGWELFVYNYYLTVPEALGDAYVINGDMTNTKGENAGKLFKNKEKIIEVLDEFNEDDPAEKNLAYQLYNLAHPLSVDFSLTKNIHGDLKPDTHYAMFTNISQQPQQPQKLKSLLGGTKKGNLLNIRTIDCNGRCGKRSTLDIPATQQFMEYVYKKYNYTSSVGNIPDKNKRDYFCKIMKTNVSYCNDMNREWAERLGKIPHAETELDVKNLQIVPLGIEDKVDYTIFKDELVIDKEKQRKAIQEFKSSPASPASSASSASRDDSSEPVPYVFFKKMGYKTMQKYVKTYYSQFSYPKMKIENGCVDKHNEKSSNIVVDYSPSQNFVSHFFTPESPYKGMLLWHSVGTGKTCSAIATSSMSFEQDDYTILWVTRTTLKSDVYKNIFDMICHHRIADMAKKGIDIPDGLGARTRMISKNWIKPISYKQFSNLLSGDNEYYEELLQRNGNEDILRKTLIIIDEAHKLYGGDLKIGERPNTDIMEKLIHNSYKKSGKDSVKLLIMTATPFTNSPMELFKLLNLMIDDKEHQFPTNIQTFKEVYMNNDDIISEKGMEKLANQTSGYISYLDRSKDASQFAQSIMIDVPVMMTHIDDPVIREHIIHGTKPGKNVTERKAETETRKMVRKQIGTLKKKLRETNKEHRETLKNHKKECKDEFPSRGQKEEREQCLENRKQREMEIHELILKEITDEIERLEVELESSILNKEKEQELKAKLREAKKSLLQEVQIANKCKLIKKEKDN